MSVQILIGDCREKLRTMADQSVHCCVTSPPYFGLRDYGCEGQMGLEQTPDEFVAGMVEVFREVRRVLRDDGTLWLNIGDSYAHSSRGGNGGDSTSTLTSGGVGKANAVARQAFEPRQFDMTGFKPKDLIGIPWMLAFALRADGWYLRQDIIWSKPNPMPESVRDRCTKAHEYLFLLSKGPRYYYDADAIAEACSPTSHGSPNVNKGAKAETIGHGQGATTTLGRWTAEDAQKGRNKRSVWEVTTQPFSEAHFATYPPALIEPCILAGCPRGGTVLDPFGGAGTTGLVADRLGRNAILIELNSEYAAIAERRLNADAGLFAQVKAA